LYVTRKVEVGKVEFSLLNAKLRGEGGEFRVRYITDEGQFSLKYFSRKVQVGKGASGKGAAFLIDTERAPAGLDNCNLKVK